MVSIISSKSFYVKSEFSSKGKVIVVLPETYLLLAWLSVCVAPSYPRASFFDLGQSWDLAPFKLFSTPFCSFPESRLSDNKKNEKTKGGYLRLSIFFKAIFTPSVVFPIFLSLPSLLNNNKITHVSLCVLSLISPHALNYPALVLVYFTFFS